ncbi:MAG: hypothetical protein AABW80_04980 [Nanoarchaeota archaeon]
MFKPEEAHEMSRKAIEAYSRRDVAGVKQEINGLIKLCLSDDFRNYCLAFTGAPTQVPEGQRRYEPADAFGFANDAIFAVGRLMDVRREKRYLESSVLVDLGVLDSFFAESPRIMKEVDMSMLDLSEE